MSRSTRPTRRNRAAKIESGEDKAVNPKFLQEEVAYQQPLPSFTAANAKQKAALSYLQSETPFVFLRGSAGSGKSMIAAYHAARLLKQKKIDKIYLIRPNVVMGKSVGLLPGELEEKLKHFFAQTIAHLEYFLGKSYTKYCLDKKIIELFATEYIRGMSFENCFVILEESQGLSHQEFETILTRRGKNSQFVMTGDERQRDLAGVSGLTSTIDMLDKALDDLPEYLDDDDIRELDDCIAVVTFTPEDCLRSGITKALVKLYYHQ